MLCWRGMTFGPLADIHSQSEARLEEMARHGVQRQILSLSIPGVDGFDAKEGTAAAREVNDALAEICHRFPDNFSAFATVALKDAAGAAAELERAVRSLGLKGGALFTHVDGRRLDESELFPFFERARELEIPLFIHPAPPTSPDGMTDYRLASLVGFMNEITLAISRLVFSGFFERLPGLKLVFTHLGGAVPFLAERIERWHRFPECREKISRPPSDYLKDLYLDTAASSASSLVCAHELTGAEKLLFGTDYPFAAADLQRTKKAVEAMPIPARERAGILGENARQLFSL
jgi:aminocarboxymuconate-semialdehyde decarboxylase